MVARIFDIAALLLSSSGAQEEAPSLGNSVLVMRLNIERLQAVAAGTVKLIGTNEEPIFESITQLVNNQDVYGEMVNAVNPYGDVNASERTVAAIAELLGVGIRIVDFDSDLMDSKDLIRAASI